MSLTPFFSVIICNYNYGDFVAQAIESVLDQDYSDFELIIVDDGSTDQSRDVINRYTDERIKVIFQENKGQAGAFNAGVARAGGNIYCFLDSDDWWTPNKLSTIKRWNDFLAGDYALLQHQVSVWDEGKTYPFKHATHSGNCFEIMKESSVMDFFNPTSALTFPRSVIDFIFPIPETLRICADAFMTRSSFTLGDVISIPKSLAMYRKHSNHVLGNSRHEGNKFNNDILFPALNQFYRDHHHDYQINDLKSRPLIFQFVEAYVRQAWTQLRGEQLVVFGSGKHSRWLEQLTKGIDGPEVVAVLDECSDVNDKLWNKSVQRPDEYNYGNELILLSSDVHQEKLCEKMHQQYGESSRLVDLYEGIEKGPYPKIWSKN